MMEDYASDLDRLVKKVPDSVTKEARHVARGRIENDSAPPCR